MQTMNILEVCSSKGWGGLELYAYDVARHLTTTRHKVMAAIRQGTLLAARMAELDIATVSLRPWLRILPLLAAWRLARYIDQQQIDILHAHWNKDLILAVLAKRLSRRKVRLLFIRHMAITRHKNDLYHRFIYANIDRYLVITHKLHEEASRYLPLDPKKLEVLYHGVAIPVKHEAQMNCTQFFTDKQLTSGIFSILLPGRIEPYKGQHLLIEAMAILRREGFMLQALIMGHVMDQIYHTAMQQQVADNNLSNVIRFAGFMQNPQQLYPCFDLVVLTTTSETFGLVLVEAMQAGVAVIGTNAGGVPEIIQQGKTGLLFQPEDSQSLANAIRSLLNDAQLRKQLAHQGQQFALKTFSREQHFARLDAIFNELVH